MGKNENKRFNAFTCLGLIKIVFASLEIFLQTASGIAVKVLETRFYTVLKISREDTNSGKKLYAVFRG